MTDIVERAKAALEGVTEGPWDANEAFGASFVCAGDRTASISRSSVVRMDNRPGRRQDHIDAEFIAAARSLVPELVAEVERLRAAHIAFTSRLGFGDNINEPAAELSDIVDSIEGAFAESSEHYECPRLCEQCGDRLAETVCSHCHGSGCGPGTASGAYSECEWCAGVGWVHEGCAEKTYAELVAEVEELRAVVSADDSTAARIHRQWTQSRRQVKELRAEVERLRQQIANRTEWDPSWGSPYDVLGDV